MHREHFAETVGHIFVVVVDEHSRQVFGQARRCQPRPATTRTHMPKAAAGILRET
jgi:hypothetical protein